ncbi:MAG: hypothetical protein IJZ68_05695 [Bacteroidaceae bacterium]|nr:hypothetical protein [Bacteroidaceae bacterium]
MRKVLALLLVCVTLCGLTACKGATENWQFKNVEKPQIKLETQEVDFEVNGKKDKVVISPFNSTIDCKAAADAISALKCMNGSTVTVTYTEKAMPVFVESQQYLTYQASHQYTIAQPDGHKIIVQYIADPDEVSGYATITVEIFEGEKKLKQSEFLQILQCVYPDDLANYLCYAEMNQTETYSYYEDVQDGAVLVCERIVKADQGAAFVISLFTTDAEPVQGYAGDFVTRAQGFQAIADTLQWSTDGMPHNVANIGLDFVQKYYGTDAYLQPIASQTSNTLVYEYKESGNQWALNMSYAITQPDENAELYVQMKATIDNDVQYTTCAVQLAALQRPSGEECAAEKAKALQMVQAFLPGVDVSKAFDENQSYDVVIDGKPAKVSFKFVFASQGNYQVATLTISTTSNPV